MNVTHRFQQLKQNSECAFIPFITAGDPDLATTAKALEVLANNGADLIELGVPYSDPLADGPTIQAAATRALQKGVKLEDVLAIVKNAVSKIDVPIILFTYYNPIYYRGIEPFLKQVKEAGVSGLVVPDLPLEEAETLLKSAADIGIEVILLVAPTSSPERIKAIAQKSQGFIYLVSVTGVTGVRSQMAAEVKDLLTTLHHATDKPIGVGFGISDPQQAKQIKDWGADAVIVGSAIVKRLESETADSELKAIAQFCHALKQAIS
ncbi:MAG: tryptophan synthase subunit alpha [Hyellaceae cyanobacterium CSU_1_1]|nr:tryptophan synthase subunit alpha [Pleurocapsa sp. CRU_1_2]NJR44568.1 tryptophan synthase subunit alpha [Hyellaceae cyanobacterium CSU_1_1]